MKSLFVLSPLVFWLHPRRSGEAVFTWLGRDMTSDREDNVRCFCCRKKSLMVSGHGEHRALVLKSQEHEPCFAPFDIAVRKRSRSWEWTVFASSGKPVMLGREYSREAANYQSTKALFLLLSACRREVITPAVPISSQSK